MFISDMDPAEMDFEGADLIHIWGYGPLFGSCEYGDEISDFMKGETGLTIRVT
jgi:hypothetical protein